jgi:RNA polymerase sigma factor (sigma-70 family)
MASEPTPGSHERSDGLDEAELLERMARGDRDALVAFVLRHRHELLGWSQRREASSLRASGRDEQDILSTVTRRLLLVFDKGVFRPASWRHARGYLYQVARNVLHRGALRARSEETALRRRSETGREADPTPDQALVECEARKALSALISDLDADDRLLLAGQLADRRDAEIAAELGITENAVRHRWMKLRRVLRAALESRGFAR